MWIAALIGLLVALKTGTTMRRDNLWAGRGPLNTVVGPIFMGLLCGGVTFLIVGVVAVGLSA